MAAKSHSDVVVDAAVHVTPAADMWTDCLPASLRALAPVIEHGEDCDNVLFEGRRARCDRRARQRALLAIVGAVKRPAMA